MEPPAAREIRSVIRFLRARNVKLADVHRQIGEVYGGNALSDPNDPNARPYSIVQVGQIARTPSSPDLATSDFHPILHLKQFLECQRVSEDDGVKEAVITWLTSQAATFYNRGIENGVLRFDKCFNKGGNYV